MLLGAGVSVTSLVSCSPTAVFKTGVSGNNQVQVPTSLFASTTLQIVRPQGYEYDVALQKMPDGNYQALLLRCTHADNPLNYTGTGYYCNLHGSTFDAKGDVTQGPAERPLRHLHTTINQERIIIQLI
jgi:Rieske Fe-S protein